MFSVKVLPLLAFFAFLIKTMVFSPTLPDSIIICALISYIILDNFTLQSKQIKEFRVEISNFKEITEKLSLDTRNLQGNVASVKLAQGMRPIVSTKQQSGI